MAEELRSKRQGARGTFFILRGGRRNTVRLVYFFQFMTAMLALILECVRAGHVRGGGYHPSPSRLPPSCGGLRPSADVDATSSSAPTVLARKDRRSS